MSAEAVEQSHESDIFLGDFVGPLDPNEVIRRRLVGSVAARARLTRVLDVRHVMDELPNGAIEQTMSGWLPETKDEVLRYMAGRTRAIDDEALLEIDMSLKAAMTDQVAKRLGGYGAPIEYNFEPQPPLDADQAWQLRAACREVPNEVFFPSDELRGAKKEAALRIAKQVCWTCEVSVQCNGAAASRPEKFGVWGIQTEADRGYSKGRPSRASKT